jgi:SAM-dependent methyltransferase/uncharacterized protein YbaR (Trm112 family)
MSDQPVASKRGEIEFRKKLIQQQVGGEAIFSDEFTREGIEPILAERMKETRDDMIALRNKGVTLSPYVEIGAERGQRSLVMENDLDATGMACDISFDVLKSCEYYGRVFGKTKVPLRICCDANSLPFKSGSIPFVFCYESLHHFPDPAPIVREIHRVVSPGGHFYFDEEPFKRVAHVNLFKANALYSPERLRAGKFRKALEFFFAEWACNETGHGIIENHQISISSWKRTLSVFEEKDIRLYSNSRTTVTLNKSRNPVKYALAYLLGGGISGLCHKPGTTKAVPVLEALLCPQCREQGRESSLARTEAGFACTSCNNRYPVVSGVVFLFSPRTFEDLYPDVFKTVQGYGH